MLNHYKDLIEDRLSEFILEHSNKDSFDPIKYIIELGGKRIRPSLLLFSVDLFSGSVQEAIDQAVAIELFHNFTLIHDDIMDQAPIRRGKETVHIKWDRNKAILSGDLLYAYANSLMHNCPSNQLSEVSKVYHQTAIEVCIGQDMDMKLEKQDLVSIDEYIEMIRLKTAVLIACSLKTGALLSEATDMDLNFIYEYGVNLGIAFQIQDDILDVYAEQKEFGKQRGGDILIGKKTILLLKAKELADKSQLEILNKKITDPEFNVEDRVNEVLNIYDIHNVKKEAEKTQDLYYQRAIIAVNNLTIALDKKKELIFFAEKLMSRKD